MWRSRNESATNALTSMNKGDKRINSLPAYASLEVDLTEIKALVIYGYGVNSHVETARAATLAGFDKVDIVHFSDILSGAARISDYGLIVFPGGFLDGDDLGAAQASAMRWRFQKDWEGNSLLDHLSAYLDAGKLMLGICNGFQLLVKLGILPALGNMRFERQVSLGHNDSGRYEDRWVRLQANQECPCIFTKGLSSLYMPVRHGEGKLAASEECLALLEKEHLIALRYVNPETGMPTMAYPANPNGSPHAIAGLTDPTGQILGLMPHPEAFHHVTNHPGWTRGEFDSPGTLLFVNAVKFLRDKA